MSNQPPLPTVEEESPISGNDIAGPPHPGPGTVARYRRLLGRAGAVCFELAPDGTALYLGGPRLTLTGYRPDELLGRNLWQTLCPGPQAAAAAALAERLRRADVADYELALTARDGRAVLVELSTANRYGSAGLEA